MIVDDIINNTDSFIKKDNLTLDDNFNLLRLLNNSLEENEIIVRDSMIRILDNWWKIPIEFREMWNDLIESVGLYPYIDTESIKSTSALRYEFHKSPNLEGIFFHSEQRKIWNYLSQQKSLILSAPTSFGKSLLIEEVVASCKYQNIVIIQPTLALLDETRNKLLKYSNKYKLILSTAETIGERNIFLLTAERVVEYNDFPKIDFFIIDEFYKLSSDRDDERYVALNIALYKLLQITNNFYFLGPNIYKIPENFTNKYNANWIRSDFTTVAVDIEKITGPRGGLINSAKEREKKLFNLLNDLNEPTIIYCSKPQRTVDLSNKFNSYLDKNNSNKSSNSSEVADVVEWIEENIHKDWSLAKIIKNGIAFHHSAIPRHLSVSLIDLFNNGDIKYLFCTSTIIEGVNTSAKNVILFDTAKGTKPIDYFDFKNISGRSGRMKRHYIGKVYQFHKEPEESNVEVDIPFFTQNKAPLELLIHLDEKDLNTTSLNKINSFNELSQNEKELIKTNFGAPIDGQIAVLNMLKNDNGTLYNLLNWKSANPSYQELEKVVQICFEYLTPKKNGNFTPGQLAVKISQFIKHKSIKALIEIDINSNYYIDKYPDYYKRVQYAVEGNLSLLRNWFSFILPKSLGILNNLQKYIFENKGLQPGNYSQVIYILENKFDQENLLPLLDYSLPVSLISKLRKYISSDISFEESIEKIASLNLNNLGLLDYEKKLINKLIKSIKKQ